MAHAGGERACAATNLHIAEALLLADDPVSAAGLLQTVSGVYRKEAWFSLLSSVLHSLRACARLGGQHVEHVAVSLQLSVLACSPDEKSSAILKSALAALETLEVDTLSVPGAAVCTAGWSSPTATPGAILSFHVAARVHPQLALRIEAATLEVELGAQPVVLTLRPDNVSRPKSSWHLFSCHLDAPESAVEVRARTVRLQIGPRIVAVCPLFSDVTPSENVPSPLPPSDPISIGAMLVARAGGIPGVHACMVAATAAPTTRLFISSPAPSLAGQRMRFTILIRAGIDGCPGCSLRLTMPGWDVDTLHPTQVWDTSGTLLSPASPFILHDIGANAEHTLELAACWTEPRNSSTLSAEFFYGTGRLQMRCEASADLPAVYAPFTLAVTYFNRWQHHSLLVVEDALPAGQVFFLAAELRTEHSLVLCSLDIEAAAGFEAVFAPPCWAGPCTLQAGDLLTQHVQVTTKRVRPFE